MPLDFLDHPVHIDGRGRTAETDEDDHIRDLIHQVLFTAPGERLNRPDFGCGIGRMVFMPNSEALATATQFLVQGALQRWLDTVIRVETVEVTAREEQLAVTVVYSKRSTGERRADLFTPSGTA
jgi:phage baseplate assembly protein W